MAVLTEMYSVVIRVPTLATRYPGGVESFATDCPNSTFCSDGEVCRVGFMSWTDTEDFVQSLRCYDISLETGTAAIIREDKGLLQPSDWLEFHRIDGTPMGKLLGSEIQVMAAPRGWVPGQHRVLKSESELGQKELVSDRDGVASYRDRATGEMLHVGRAFPKTPSPKPWWRFWD